MKLKSMVLLAGVSVALPVFAAGGAAAAPALSGMDPPTIGRLDALLTTCAKTDAKNRANYQRYRAELIVFGEGTPYEMRAPGSDTPEYKSAYAEVVEALGRASTEELAETCGRMIQTNLAEHLE